MCGFCNLADGVHNDDLITSGLCRMLLKPLCQLQVASQPFPFSLSGTTVVSAWLKVRIPSLVIFSCEGQFGSGQAIKASVVIQSFA